MKTSLTSSSHAGATSVGAGTDNAATVRTPVIRSGRAQEGSPPPSSASPSSSSSAAGFSFSSVAEPGRRRIAVVRRRLTPQAEAAVSKVFTERAGMQPKSQIYGADGLQAPAPPTRIFELRKNGDAYSLHAGSGGAPFVPPPDGEFIYVVRANDPGRVYVAIDAKTGPIELRQHGVQGHTSFDAGSDALFAGELALDQGKLVSWDNASGHYRLGSEQRHVNLLPVVQQLLPESKYESTGKPVTLKLAAADVPLADLVRLGATVKGEPLWGALLTQGKAAVQADLINRIQFKEARVERAMQTPESARVLDLLTEVAAARTNSEPLIVRPADLPAATLTAGDLMNRQLQRITGVLARAGDSAKQLRSNVITYVMPGGQAVRHTGVGLQAFGVRRSLAEIGDAVARGDNMQAFVSSTALAAEAGSVALESGLPRLGSYLQKTDIPDFNTFNSSSLGQRLGGTATAGKHLARGASAAGTLLTLPFDIYSATRSFSKAGATTGLEAQDHYVNGGFSTAATVTSIGLGGAAMAGVTAAGPIGVGIGLTMAVANQIYGSVRHIDNVREHAPLDAGERLWHGLRHFFGAGTSQSLLDRVAVGKARKEYHQQKSRQMLNVLTLSGDRQAIFGNARITAQAPRSSTRVKTVHGAVGGPYQYKVTTTEQRPPEVFDNAGDDNIDASHYLGKIANLVRVSADRRLQARDSLLWATGDGNDRLRGASLMPNTFELGRGRKVVSGGSGNDLFNLSGLPEAGSSYDGRGGSNTLSLHGNVSLAAASLARQQALTKVTLPGGSAGKVSSGEVELATLHAIDNVSTPEGGRSLVVGNVRDNVFVMNGADHVKGGAGNDTYFVKGAGPKIIESGTGINRYHIDREVDSVIVLRPAASGSRQVQGRTQIQLDYDLGEFDVVASRSNLSINLGGNKRLTMYGVSESDEKGGWRPVSPDENLVIVTRDGVALTPLLHRAGGQRNGLVELVATHLADFGKPATAGGA